MQVDLTNMSRPTGPYAVALGETLHVQAWYRDRVGGAPTSNFTDALTLGFQ